MYIFLHVGNMHNPALASAIYFVFILVCSGKGSPENTEN